MTAARDTVRGHLVRVKLVRERSVTYERHVGRPQEAAAFAREVLRGRDRELFVCIHLSSKHDVLSAEVVAIGTLNATLVHPREVFKGAILANAAAVVLAHNHPSGHTEPSQEDLALTSQLLAAGDVLGVAVEDHVIIAGEKWLSLRETTALWAAAAPRAHWAHERADRPEKKEKHQWKPN